MRRRVTGVRPEGVAKAGERRGDRRVPASGLAQEVFRRLDMLVVRLGSRASTLLYILSYVLLLVLHSVPFISYSLPRRYRLSRARRAS